VQLTQQPEAILGPPLAAVVNNGKVWQIVKHQPFAVRSDGPVKIFVEEEVVLVERTNAVFVVHSTAAHVKRGPEKPDRKCSIKSRWEEDDAEGRPEFLRRRVRIDELNADPGDMLMTIQVVNHLA